MKLAVQMDPIRDVKVDHDTSFAFMLEAQSRGHDVFYFSPRSVRFDAGVVRADVHKVRVQAVQGEHVTFLDGASSSLHDYDAVLIRQDPPFDLAYYANTLLLDPIEDDVVVLNSPRGVRNVSEKLSALRWKQHIAPTFVGSDLEQIRAFCRQFPQVVLKPLFWMGGQGVIRTSVDAPDFDERTRELLGDAGADPIIAQQFLEGVFEGDKRVMVLDGEVVGVVGRMPQGGDFRANLHVGGKAVAADLSPAERAICEEVGRDLIADGVLFAGLDLIGGYLNEVNVTSPTLVQELRRLGGPDVAKLFIDAVERRVAARA